MGVGVVWVGWCLCVGIVWLVLMLWLSSGLNTRSQVGLANLACLSSQWEDKSDVADFKNGAAIMPTHVRIVRIPLCAQRAAHRTYMDGSSWYFMPQSCVGRRIRGRFTFCLRAVPSREAERKMWRRAAYDTFLQ